MKTGISIAAHPCMMISHWRRKKNYSVYDVFHPPEPDYSSAVVRATIEETADLPIGQPDRFFPSLPFSVIHGRTDSVFA